MQGMIDFDTPTENQYKPETDYAHTLTISMEKGKMLGEPLRNFVEEARKDTIAKRGDVFIVMTRTGIKIENHCGVMAYPRGVTAQGNGTITVRAEALYRMLVRSVKKPSWIDGYTQAQMTAPETLANDRTTISINGKCEVKTGTFTATLATRTAPMPPDYEYNRLSYSRTSYAD